MKKGGVGGGNCCRDYPTTCSFLNSNSIRKMTSTINITSMFNWEQVIGDYYPKLKRGAEALGTDTVC